MKNSKKGGSKNTFDAADAIAVMSALSQPSRIEIFRLLVRYLPFGLAAGDIARLLALTPNTMSTHLTILENAGLVLSRREGRSIIYAANTDMAVKLSGFLMEDCCKASDTPAAPRPFPAKREAGEVGKPLNVLFLCTGNSARSIMAEAILNREGGGWIKAYSAGSKPAARVNATAIAVLDELGYPTPEFRTKNWNEFSSGSPVKMDFVITLCDAAAGEICPVWSGRPLAAHWGIPDPSAVRGTEAEKRAAFLQCYRQLAARVTTFVNLDLAKLDRPALRARLASIAAMEGATDKALGVEVN